MRSRVVLKWKHHLIKKKSIEKYKMAEEDCEKSSSIWGIKPQITKEKELSSTSNGV